MIALIDDLQCLVVARRDERAAGFALVKELFLGDLVGLGVMGDEDDLDVLITGADKLVEEKEEAPRRDTSSSCPWSRTCP